MSSKKKTIDPQELFLSENPDHSLVAGLGFGAQDSAHSVFFTNRKNGMFAVKPFKGKDAYDNAQHEAQMLEKVASLGFLTVRPIGVVQSSSDLTTYLLTEYDPKLTSMSAIVQSSDPKIKSNMPKLLGGVAQTLGELHVNGISHGDAQIKNAGFFAGRKKVEYPAIGFFDFERGGSPETGHAKNDPFVHDIESVVQSLAHKGYGGPNPNYATELVHDRVIEPYHETVRSAFGEEEAERIAYLALNTFITKHDELNSHRAFH